MLNQTLDNRYKVIAQLGRGAMGLVYRATDRQSRQDVAVKVIARELALEADMLARFRREGEALRQLRHRNIVAFVGMFEHQHQQVIVMEYVPGGDLHALIKRGPLPPAEVVRITLQLCDALVQAHDIGIIHRDIKPENVLLTTEGVPKLTDFGIARLVGGTTGLTHTGAVMGTPYYMSPEAWAGRPLDAQADVWSLGVMVYQMASGQLPFAGDTLPVVMNKVLTEAPPDLRALRPEVPEPLVSIIERMLARDKAQRYETMRQVAVDLEQVQRDLRRAREASQAQETRLNAEEEQKAGVLQAQEEARQAQAARLKAEEEQRAAALQAQEAARRQAEAEQQAKAEARRKADSEQKAQALRAEEEARLVAQHAARPPEDYIPTQLMRSESEPAQRAKAISPRTLALMGAGALALVCLVAVGGLGVWAAAGKFLASPKPPTIAPTPSLGIGSTLVSDKDGMTLVYVPAGNFPMGSAAADQDAKSDEKPQHTVFLDAYWIDKTVVTNAMYAKCVRERSCQPPSSTSSSTRSNYYGNAAYDNFPVVWVSRNDANAYCAWAGRRLPTEAEWEKAARGTDGRKYPWGNQPPDPTLLNFNNQVGDTTLVGQYPAGASPYGALDMAGNVWQWVADWYSDTYYARSPNRNPAGPPPGDGRVLRAGSWSDEAAVVRATVRDWGTSDGRHVDDSFRCARSP